MQSECFSSLSLCFGHYNRDYLPSCVQFENRILHSQKCIDFYNFCVIISYVDSCGRHLEVYYHMGLAISKLIKPWKEVHILSDFHLMLNKQFGRELHKQKDVPWVRNSPIYYCSEYPQFFFPGAHVFFKPHCWSGWNS